MAVRDLEERRLERLVYEVNRDRLPLSSFKSSLSRWVRRKTSNLRSIGSRSPNKWVFELLKVLSSTDSLLEAESDAQASFDSAQLLVRKARIMYELANTPLEKVIRFLPTERGGCNHCIMLRDRNFTVNDLPLHAVEGHGIVLREVG